MIYFIPLRLAPAWIVILILAREFLVTSLRLIASGKGIVIAADKWGKYKTATTMVWICYALLMTNFIDTMSIGMQSVCTGIHIALMILSLALTLLSGFNYLWKNRCLLYTSIPVRLDIKEIGGAHVTFVRSRPKLIGGPRAEYPEN